MFDIIDTEIEKREWFLVESRNMSVTLLQLFWYFVGIFFPTILILFCFADRDIFSKKKDLSEEKKKERSEKLTQLTTFLIIGWILGIFLSWGVICAIIKQSAEKEIIYITDFDLKRNTTNVRGASELVTDHIEVLYTVNGVNYMVIADTPSAFLIGNENKIVIEHEFYTRPHFFIFGFFTKGVEINNYSVKDIIITRKVYDEMHLDLTARKNVQVIEINGTE